ncbi:MAG: tetratricopeptide repeat protein, partial [bacterium]
MTELPLRAAVRRIVRLVTLGAVVALAGCAASTRVTDESRSLLAAGQIEQGLATLERALEKDPRNREILLYYRQQRELSITGLLLAGDVALQAGNYDEAERNYRRVLLLSPGEARAVARLRTVEVRVRTADVLAEALGGL